MNKKNAIILVISIVLLGLLIFGGTYAYWSWTSNTNKNVVFNTAKELIEYVEYDDGESTFLGDFKVSSSYNQGIHSTISIKKKDDPDVANVDLVATIMMDINSIGNNMKVSPALKWVVTSGDSTNVGAVLAKGNFIGTNGGDTLTLYPSIPVTTSEQKFTVWIWIDASENPSELLSGETLDTVVWTQIDQVEGVEESFTITRISSNNQNISATAVNSKHKITDYAVVTTEGTPSSWTSIASADQSNIYTLDYTATSTGTYYVWFKDETGKTVSRSVTVSTIDSTGPVCTFGNWNPTSIVNGQTSSIELTCTDAESQITNSNLTTSDFTASNSNAITIKSITKTAVTNGYKYTIGVEGKATNGTSTITLTSNKVKNSSNLGNTSVTSGSVTVANSMTLTIKKNGNNCTDCNGYAVHISTSSSSDTASFTGTTTTSSTLTINGTMTLGTTYYVWVAKDSNHKTAGTNNANMAYSGVSFTGGANNTSTDAINFYEITGALNHCTMTFNAISLANNGKVTALGTNNERKIHSIVASSNTGYSFANWNSSSALSTIASTNNTSTTMNAGAATTLTANCSGNTYAATFYYNSGSGNGTLSVATEPVECTVSNIEGNCTVSVPDVVSNSVGRYGSTYKGVNTNTGTMKTTSTITLTGDDDYYANYSEQLTVYYPTSASACSNSGTLSIYRNEYFTSASAMGAVISASNNDTTKIGSLTISGIKGTFKGLTNTVNSSTYKALGTGSGNFSDTYAGSTTINFYAVVTDSENVTFKYNQNTTPTCNTTSIKTTTSSATSTYYCSAATTATVSHGSIKAVPSAVSGSKGPHNTSYRAMAAVNSLTAVTSFKGGSTYYAIYTQAVTNNYYNSSYTTRTLYRNEYLASASATSYTTKLATANTGTSNAGTAAGPGSSVFIGFSTEADTTAEYADVAAAAPTCSNTLYSVYQFNVSYTKGTNVSSMGTTTGVGIGSCKVSSTGASAGGTSCNVTLPSVTANAGYHSTGWWDSSTNVGAAGATYALSTNAKSLEARATENNYTVTIKAGAGVSSVSLSDWTNSGTGSMSKSLPYNSTLDLSSVAVTYKSNAYSGRGYFVFIDGTGEYGSSTLTVPEGGAIVIIDATDLAAPTCTLSGGNVTKVFGYQSTTLTATNGTSYDSSVSLEYQFGYATSSTGTLGSWSTSTKTPTYIITSTAFIHAGRYFGTKITATGDERADGSSLENSCISGSGASNRQMVGLVNARIDFDATTNRGTLSGTSPLYARYNRNSTVYTTRAGSTAGTIPTATKDGYTFNGWYTQGGTKVINADGTLVVSVSGWTNTNKYWILTNPDNTANTNKLVAQFIKSNYYVFTAPDSGNGSYYETLSDAFEHATSGQTVRALTSDGEENANPTVAFGKTIKLDLNGQTVSLGSYYINNLGTLDIYSSATGGTLQGENKTLYGVIYNQGTLTTNGTNSVNPITIQNTSNKVNARVLNNATGKSAILNTNTTLKFTTAHTSTASYRNVIYTNGTVEIAGATIENKVYSRSNQVHHKGIYIGNANGRVVMTSGTIDTSGSAIHNGSGNGTTTPAIDISGGTVQSSNDYGIYEDATGTVNVSGGRVEGTVGIYNSDRNASIINISGTADIEGLTGNGITGVNATINVSAGTITGKTNGIELTTGTVNMGNNDSTVSTTSPVISSLYSGAYGVNLGSSGTFNFYDGKVTSVGGTGYAINGSANTPTGYSVYKNTVGNVETAILVADSANYINIDTSNTYGTLASAFAGVAANATNTIQALTSNGSESSNPTVASGKTIILDLNGQTVSLGTYYISNSGTLDVYNSSSTAATLQGSNTSSSYGVIYNNGTLTTNGTNSVNPITIQNTSNSVNARVLFNNANKTATLNENTTLKFTTAHTSSTSSRNVIYTNGTVKIAGATIENKVYSRNNQLCHKGIYIGNANGRVVMTSGTIDTYGSAIHNGSGNGTTTPAIDISGGTVQSSNNYGIYEHATGTVNISGTASVSGKIGIFSYTGGTINISGTADIEGLTGGGINGFNSTINVSGGTITGSNGIYVESGTINVTGGTITGSDSGVYIGGEGTLNMGNDDGTVSTTSPVISSTALPNSGEYYGVKISTGIEFNFYDGKVTSTMGAGYAINRISNTAQYNDAVANISNGVEEVILWDSASHQRSYHNTNNNIYYTNLSQAFDAVKSNQTIELVRHGATETSIATLESNKTGVKLDLTGGDLNLGDYAIKNLGGLDIYNSSSNTATLIGKGYDANALSSPNSVRADEKTIIYNNGTLIMNGTDSAHKIRLEIDSSYQFADAILTDINGTTIINTNATIINQNDLNLTNNGSFNYLILSYGIVNLYGGTVLNSSTVDSYIEGGIALLNANARFSMIDGKLEAPGFAINNWSGTGTTSPAVSISSGTITSYTYTAIHNRTSGTVEVLGGTITGGEQSCANSFCSGVYLHANTGGTLKMGTNGGTPSTTNPVISSIYGNGITLNSGCTLQFYDGKVTSSLGSGKSIYGSGTITTQSGYQVKRTVSGGVETAILGT